MPRRNGKPRKRPWTWRAGRHEHHEAETEEAFRDEHWAANRNRSRDRVSAAVEARVSTDFRARACSGRSPRPARPARRRTSPARIPTRGRGGRPRIKQHRRPQLISEMLKAGEEIIVQIAKEPLGKKGARITSHVALPGALPGVHADGGSHRRLAENRFGRKTARDCGSLVNEARAAFPGGFIVRTAAEPARATKKFAPTSNSWRARGQKSARAPSSAARLRCSTAT